jgi:predicted dinucleotide-binding enzyme
MGSKLGTIFARAGHEVVFSYARTVKKLEKHARDAGRNARAGTPAEATREADAFLLAVHWSRFADVLKQAGDLSSKIVVTCSLPMNAQNTALVIAHTSSGAEELAKMVPQARVVSAFNTVPSEVLFNVFEARRKAGRPSLVYRGDDTHGKAARNFSRAWATFARTGNPSHDEIPNWPAYTLDRRGGRQFRSLALSRPAASAPRSAAHLVGDGFSSGCLELKQIRPAPERG